MAPAGAGGRGFSASQGKREQLPASQEAEQGTLVAKEFCQWWDTMQVQVFGFTSPHTRKDVSATEKLVSNGASLQLLQAVTIGAWNYYLDKDRQNDKAFWHCIKFSGNLKSFIQYFQVIMVKELSLQKSDANYRSRINEILTGWMPCMLEQAQGRLRLNEEPAVVTA